MENIKNDNTKCYNIEKDDEEDGENDVEMLDDKNFKNQKIQLDLLLLDDEQMQKIHDASSSDDDDDSDDN